ncbi:hypothetical protein Tsubulata_007691 [Turnera subulata]|uniref:FLZ-type domain-containing protein n=1 Tax=Turnera subulata TaxID=218843 RepID=A0A9Q0FPY3_9ROSI|nr:hypothetical protein Tsubulata_007691 [Turnera subulata]
MLSKRPHPMIGRLSELLVSGNRGRFLDMATSPRSPLDYKIQSPGGGLKNYDLGGVGLGIVAALEKSSGDGGREVLAKYAISSPNSNRSDPIPVNSGKNCLRFEGVFDEMEMESLEDYTCVTRRDPGNSFTKVYYGGGKGGKNGNGAAAARTHDKLSVFCIAKELPATYSDDVASYPASDFLSSCHLCKKKLHGKDIYMYRGEKGFCSAACRSSHILKDERKEQCRSEVARSADVSSSSYTRSPIFSTGIVVI